MPGKLINTKRSTLYRSEEVFTTFRVYNAKGDRRAVANARQTHAPSKLLCVPGVAQRLHTPFAERLRPFLVPLVSFQPVTNGSHGREGREDMWVCSVDGLTGVKAFVFGSDKYAHERGDIYITNANVKLLAKKGYIK